MQVGGQRQSAVSPFNHAPHAATALKNYALVEYFTATLASAPAFDATRLALNTAKGGRFIGRSATAAPAVAGDLSSRLPLPLNLRHRTRARGRPLAAPTGGHRTLCSSPPSLAQVEPFAFSELN
jgi:hypothetical protein